MPSEKDWFIKIQGEDWFVFKIANNFVVGFTGRITKNFESALKVGTAFTFDTKELPAVRPFDYNPTDTKLVVKCVLYTNTIRAELVGTFMFNIFSRYLFIRVCSFSYNGPCRFIGGINFFLFICFFFWFYIFFIFFVTILWNVIFCLWGFLLLNPVLATFFFSNMYILK